MTKDLNRGGVFSNLDLAEIDPKTRTEAEQVEYAVGVLDEAKDEARKSGGGDHFSIYESGEKEDATEASAQFLKKTEREAANEAAIRPLRQIVGDPESPFGYTWVLTERDAGLVNEWRNCPACLQAQASTSSSQCEWRHQNAGVKGCGYNRVAMKFFDDHGSTKG